MEIQPPSHDLEKKILELIQSGIMIEDEVMHYIDSTFSNPSAEELAVILSDPSNFETETVLELIFYPDLQMQEKIESTLKTNNYNINDVESVINCLSQKKITVPLTLTDHRGSLTVLTTDSIIRQFMRRLNITRQIDARLTKTLSRFVEDKAGDLRIRVLLRNCRAEFSEKVCAFLCLCIEKMYVKSPFFLKALTFLLDFFEYFDSEADIYSGLMGEKKALLHNIEQADKNEQALKKSCVEALMLKGVSLLSIDVAAARKKIVLIDHICISIFGKTELYGYAEQIETPVTVKNFTSDDFI